VRTPDRDAAAGAGLSRLATPTSDASHAEPPVTDNEEEFHTILTGAATLRVAGEDYLLEPGVFARAGAAEKRQLTTGAEGAEILCIGATPERAYEPLPIVELGGPESVRRISRASARRGARHRSRSASRPSCSGSGFCKRGGNPRAAQPY
jgi:hypothetical protein